MLRTFFKKIRTDTEELRHGRSVLIEWSQKILKNKSGVIRILDIGCGSGIDIENIRNANTHVTIEAHGVELLPHYIIAAKEKSITITSINIEHDTIPFQEGYFDIIILNQILEHTKELFWILSEVGRVLKPGGSLIIGVPNLASLHNRVLLLIGHQPSCMQLYGAHSRGFTKNDFISFVTRGDVFHFDEYAGSNFYPFPPLIAKPLAQLLPSLAVGNFYLFTRTKKGDSFLKNVEGAGFETNYYTGPARL